MNGNYAGLAPVHPGAAPNPDAPRNEAMARVRVTMGQATQIFGQYLGVGDHEITIYRSEIENDSIRGKSLRSRTRTAEDERAWADAIEADAAAFELWQSENKGKTRVSYKGSPEAEFYRRNRKRGLPPIVKFEVLEDDLPPPPTPESEAVRNARATAQAIREAMGSGRDHEVNELRAQVAALTEAVKALTEKKTRGPRTTPEE